MKLIITLFIFTVLSFSVSAIEKAPPIKFTSNNYFAVTSTFNETLLEDFTKKLLTYDKPELYIYFDSPGGSVFAVTRMISLMKMSDIKFTCVARFAASAAFTMFQQCNKRYLLNDGILMSHNAAGGFQGEFPRIESIFNAINDIVIDAEKETAEKLKMKFEDYKIAINNNLWLSKVSAPKYNAIDGIAEKITCTKKSINEEVKRNVTTCGFFSCTTETIFYSACPLLTSPLKKDNETKKIITDLKKDPIKNFMHIAPGFLLKK
jgi:ATP-dependent protease ClpP protease subunit